jgi:hypothetical protein
MANITKLIGSDGYVALGEIGSEVVGDAVKTLDELAGGVAADGTGKGFWQVTGIAASGSVFNWTEAKVGDYFWDDGTLVPIVGDKAIQLPTSADTSIKSFEITLTADKIDTTTLTDDLKTYRMGRDDAAGTMTGVTTVGNEILSDRFLDRLEVSTPGTFTINRKTKAPLYFVGYLQGEEISGETLVAIVGKIEPEGFTYGATDGSAQEFSSGFAPTAGDKLQKINITVA